MSGRCLARSLRVHVAQRAIRPSSTHNIIPPQRRSSSLTVPTNSDSNLHQTPVASTSSSPLNYYQELRLETLKDALESQAGPSTVWSAYASLVGIADSRCIPLEIHQQVLRRCWPSSAVLRQAVVNALQQGNLPDVSDLPEERFYIVLRNIRSAGFQPTLDDFNFILRRFSVVAHYQGCWKIYKDLKEQGYAPSQATYGYCFQSIAHRFSLPIPKATRETMVVITQDMFSNYMADMQKYQILMNPVTFDLAIRILKETLDAEGFEKLMRWGYGLDLSNPDRLALEFSTEQVGNRLVPFPFTTTALNTTIDVLGRLGNIPKMVYAFEVLTQPLTHANQHFFNAFESDENDDYGVKVDVDTRPHIPIPYANPNTTTYNLLLRYICRTGHAVFARHYLNYARMNDRQTAHKIRNDVGHARRVKTPLEELPSPRLNMNAGMLLPLLGEANKDKNLGLLKWLKSKMPIILRKCKSDLDFFSSVLDQIKQERLEEVPAPDLTKPFPTPTLDLDIENPPPPAEQTAFKPFNIDLHVAILSRNYSQLEEFDKRLSFILGRTHERIKERLGRRVWEGKDVFVTDKGTRLLVSKQKWREVVNFRPRSDSYCYRAKIKPWVPNVIEGSRPRGRRISLSSHAAGRVDPLFVRVV